MSANNLLTGLADLNTTADQFNATHFLMQRLLARINTATLVQIIDCTNEGGLSAVGFVDVQVLPNQMVADGTTLPGAQIFHLPYFRLQGGASAVIMDPMPGDVGIAVFAQQDISVVKQQAAQATPGSFRRFDLADGLYLGGFVNGVPNQYVQFVPNGGGINLVSPSEITLQGPQINLVGQVNQSGGTISAATDVVVAGLSVINHSHPGVQSGSGNTGAMQD